MIEHADPDVISTEVSDKIEMWGKEYQLHGDRILVRIRQGKTEASGGIQLLTPVEKPQDGIVLAVGPGRITEHGALIPVTVKPGDIVNFGQHAGQKVKFNGEDLLMLREPDLFGHWTA